MRKKYYVYKNGNGFGAVSEIEQEGLEDDLIDVVDSEEKAKKVLLEYIVNANIEDNNGVFIGTSSTGGSIIFDDFVGNKNKIKKFNGVILGVPGEGRGFRLRELKSNKK
ncbi:hypothetical protein ACV3OB_16045 [Clostridium perfringens]